MQSVNHPKTAAVLLMLSGNLPTVDSATFCKTGQSSLPWCLSCNILLLPLHQMSLNNLIPLKIIFMFYYIDFWQGQVPDAVGKGDCLSRTYSCAGKGWKWSRPFSRDGTSFAPMLCSPPGSNGSSFTNTLKSAFLPTGLVILLIPSFPLSFASTSISMSV